MKRAFTLIELLVVIAIIAILAAILFPVFAQAKAAAKKTVALSNVKENALAELMYGGDVDDTMVPAVAYGLDGAPAYIGASGYQPWSWLIQPYTKSADILVDPLAPPLVSFGAGWKDATQKALAPTFGYNATYLSPTLPVNGALVQTPISGTSVAAPSETVMMTSKFSNGETNQGPTGFYWYGAGSVPTVIMIDVPDCNSAPGYCYGNWGTGGFWDATYLKTNEQAGARTGGMSVRGTGLAEVSWTDGHASAKAPGYMAQGTNWNRTRTSSSVTTTDVTKYLWDDK